LQSNTVADPWVYEVNLSRDYPVRAEYPFVAALCNFFWWHMKNADTAVIFTDNANLPIAARLQRLRVMVVQPASRTGDVKANDVTTQTDNTSCIGQNT
jgi:hypothetical protein